MSLELTRETDGEYCTGCGSRLIWGKFAYNQELCWDCFEERVILIASRTQTRGDKAIVRHLLAIAKEVHNIK